MKTDRERIDELHVKGLKIVQDPSCFCYGTDAVLLADFATRNLNGNFQIIDFCTGNAIIPILMKNREGKLPFKASYTALELQDRPFELALKSVGLNAMNQNIKVLQGDIREAQNMFPAESFDAVTCNPPYMKPSDGRQSSNIEKMTARQELKCTLEDVFRASSHVLKDGGDFFMIHRPSRIKDIYATAAEYPFSLIQERFVKPSPSKEASMVLLHYRKATAEQDSKITREPLIIRDDEGNYTEELKEIYSF
ncbi:MAG: methyltransferase [Treponema sp.]|nr:methyltransferase [Treponema sp.]